MRTLWCTRCFTNFATRAVTGIDQISRRQLGDDRSIDVEALALTQDRSLMGETKRIEIRFLKIFEALRTVVAIEILDAHEHRPAGSMGTEPCEETSAKISDVQRTRR